MKAITVLTTAFVAAMVLLSVLAIPFIVAGQSFTIWMLCWLVSMLICLFLALIIGRKSLARYFSGKRLGLIQSISGMEKPDRFLFIILMTAIILQTATCAAVPFISNKAVTYIAAITEAVQENTMFTKDIATGEPMAVSFRQMIADIDKVFLLLWAAVSKLTGLAPALVARTVAPIFMIPLSYMAYALLADKLFQGEKRKQFVFLLFLILLQTMGRQSEVTQDAFLLHSSFTGKTMMFQIFMPYGIYCIYTVLDWFKTGRKKG